MPKKHAKPKLHYFSFDSLGNPWVSGGGAVRDWEILSRWRDKADITLFTARYPGFQSRVENGVRIRGIGFGSSHALARVGYSLSANVHALFSRADILGISPSIFAPVFAGLLRSSRSYAVIHHAVGNSAIEKYGPLLGRVFVGIEKILFRFQWRWAVSNPRVLDRIRASQPGADLLLTANGIDPELLSLAPQVSDRPYILFLGRFDRHMKGLDILLKAYVQAFGAEVTGTKSSFIDGNHSQSSDEERARIRRDAESHSFPELILAGRSTEAQKQELEVFIPRSMRKHVRMEVHVGEERKRELLRGCLFFCSPSRFEGFGIAALEANAVGKAVLATRVDGFFASLKDGETAQLVEPDSIRDLAEVMGRWIKEPQIPMALGKEGREWARGFSWDAIAEREWEWVVAQEYRFTE
jgi:glycosyltransferase involved in cell wall biosynthesis